MCLNYTPCSLLQQIIISYIRGRVQGNKMSELVSSVWFSMRCMALKFLTINTHARTQHVACFLQSLGSPFGRHGNCDAQGRFLQKPPSFSMVLFRISPTPPSASLYLRDASCKMFLSSIHCCSRGRSASFCEVMNDLHSEYD